MRPQYCWPCKRTVLVIFTNQPSMSPFKSWSLPLDFNAKMMIGTKKIIKNHFITTILCYFLIKYIQCFIMGNSGRLLYGVSSQHDLYHKDFFWCWFIIRDNYILDFSSPSWFDTHSMIPNDTAVTSKCFNNDQNYHDYYQYSDYDHSPSLRQ